ncbi:MAG: hypothetical protein RR922_01950 [Clostridia bacterium]
MNKKDGMSLIVLVITIIVMIILSGVVIMALSKNNPILKANEATFKSDIKSIESMVSLDITTKSTDKYTDELYTGELTEFGIESSSGIYKKYGGILYVEDNNLVIRIGYTTNKKNKQMVEWAAECGIKMAGSFASGGFDGLINTPELTQGLIPVKYNDNKKAWVIADPTNSLDFMFWHDYPNAQWANAVTLKPNSQLRKKLLNPNNNMLKASSIGDFVNESINMDEVNSFWVWIPSFKLGDVTPANEKSGSDITFCRGKEDKKKVHKAFLFGDKVLNGIWVSKFSMSKNSDNIEVKPDVDALNFLLPVPAHRLIRGMENITKAQYYGWANEDGYNDVTGDYATSHNKLDVHMIKNSEWAATAYLSNSIYGKLGNNEYALAEKEVYINNSFADNNKKSYTGRSGGAPGGAVKLKPGQTKENSPYGYYTYDGKNVKQDTGEILDYAINKNSGYGASTTGNIYGAFDMSGGYETIVAAICIEKDNPNKEQLTYANSKYLEVYGVNEYKKGDATLEAKNFYGDMAYMIANDYRNMARGIKAFMGRPAGIFGYTRVYEWDSGINTSRPVIVADV